MSKLEWFGFGALGSGAVFGFVFGDAFGLFLACACLVVGLVLLVARTALGPEGKVSNPGRPAESKTGLLVLLKEVHARPQRTGKFQEITNPDQAGLEFELFVHCWLVNDTDERLGIATSSVSLTKPDGTQMVLQSIPGGLENWRLGRLRDELDTWGVRYLQASPEAVPELRIQEPLNGGSTREGWLHLHVEGLTPAEIRNSTIELEVIDSHVRSHTGAAKGPHQVPGRVWPFQQEPKPAIAPSLGLPPDAPHPSLG
jgi:hypothetical protein